MKIFFLFALLFVLPGLTVYAQDLAKKAVEDKFFLAIEDGKEKAAKFYLENGVSLNARHSNGKTGLMIAAEKGYVGIVKLLLSKGADKKATFKDSDGKEKTAFNLAVEAHQKKTAGLVK